MDVRNSPTPHEYLLSLGGKRKRDGATSITGKRVPDSQLVQFFADNIKLFMRRRKDAEAEWQVAIDAYRGHDRRSHSMDIWSNPFGAGVRIGLPYALTQTTVAAIVASMPSFSAKPATEKARGLAKLVHVLLNNDSVWDAKKRQWQMGKLVKSGKMTGLMIGKVHYETDYDAWQKRIEKEEKEEARRSGLTRDELATEELLDVVEREEFATTKGVQKKELTGEADHTLRREEIGMQIMSAKAYIADPHATDFVYGPRWEGRLYNRYIKDVKNDKRFRGDARLNVKPTHTMRRELRFPFRRNPGDGVYDNSLPEDFQQVELAEIYWYDDPEFKDSYGSLITLVVDQDLLLERRPNPYGRRPYVVEEWNGDLEDPFPCTDINGWVDLWRATREVLYRAVRQIRKAPNTTLLVAKGGNNSADQLQGVLDNDDGGVAEIDISGVTSGGLDGVVKELATRQVSPEYLNFIDKMMLYIQMIEGFGPNQLAGGALKSETSGTEAAEVAKFVRVRLDDKANALDRFMTRMARNIISAIFRFKEFDEIVDMVGEDLAQMGIAEEELTRARAANIEDVSINIVPGSMAPEADGTKLQKVMAILQANGLDQILSQKCDRDALAILLNDATRLQTGRDLYVDLDSPMANLNAMQQLLGGPQGSAPRAAPAQGGAGGLL